jgi:hypothetical protein
MKPSASSAPSAKVVGPDKANFPRTREEEKRCSDGDGATQVRVHSVLVAVNAIPHNRLN